LLTLALVNKSAAVVGGRNNNAPPSASRNVVRNLKIMNAEAIIKDEVAKFFAKNVRVRGRQSDPIDFKNNLLIQLENFYEKVDRLIFLYQLSRKIDMEYENHIATCPDRETPEKCPTNMNYKKCQFFLEQEIRALNPSFEFTILRPSINSNLIKDNMISLRTFPEAASLFQAAMDKLNEAKFQRNLLDDLRLAVEVILKQVLKNSKSLENQIDSLGEFLKQRGTSKEAINMFRVLVDYYTKYQNTYVKHNDAIKEKEVDLLINLTSAFINFLIHEN
jgi:hypothetical protein